MSTAIRVDSGWFIPDEWPKAQWVVVHENPVIVFSSGAGASSEEWYAVDSGEPTEWRDK